MPEHPVAFADQLKQLVELHRVAKLAMKDLIIRVWPREAGDGGLSAARHRQAISLYRRCPHGLRSLQDVVGEDGRRRGGQGAAGGQGAPHTRAIFCGCPGGVSTRSSAVRAGHYF